MCFLIWWNFVVVVFSYKHNLASGYICLANIFIIIVAIIRYLSLSMRYLALIRIRSFIIDCYSILVFVHKYENKNEVKDRNYSKYPEKKTLICYIV